MNFDLNNPFKIITVQLHFTQMFLISLSSVRFIPAGCYSETHTCIYSTEYVQGVEFAPVNSVPGLVVLVQYLTQLSCFSISVYSTSMTEVNLIISIF